jgi:hypothetical protein
MALSQVADVVVPSVFTPYVQQITEEKSRLIQSGALVRDSAIDALLAGGGLTFNVPSWKDITNDTENVSTDTEYDYDGGDNSAPKKLGTATEVAVRLSRNQSWAASNLAADLAGSDPMMAIADRVANYWSLRLQAAFVATIKGVFADNAAVPSGSEHTQNDMTYDIKGSSYTAGTTDFNASAFIDACQTMGDSAENLGIVMVHSVVFARMQKNNLIDFIPDSEGRPVRSFLGKQVIVDDSLPYSSGVYDTWIFGAGAVRLGIGTPKYATEVQREPNAGNGGGEDILYNRVMWCIHPVGNKYAGTAANGGPTNAATSNNLAAAGSWQRVYPERKQIKIARLITRES